jgi:hypothetical protein
MVENSKLDQAASSLAFSQVVFGLLEALEVPNPKLELAQQAI